MSRYEDQRAKRRVVIGGRTYLRRASVHEAAREFDAALLDLVASAWQEESFLIRFWTALAVLLPLALLIRWLV